MTLPPAFVRSFGLLALVAASLSGCAEPPRPPPPAPPPSAAVPAAAPAKATEVIDGATAKKLVRDGGRLIDVRSPEEFADKHIDGAENIPVDAIESRDLGSKDAPIVLYCRSGNRSARVSTALRAKGYTRVFDLGAMSKWHD